MASQAISDFITKQLFIERDIVTYRSLSRQFSIHVNTAKNELAIYHASAAFQGQTSSATYLLSGETSRERFPITPSPSQDVEMEDESRGGEDSEPEEDGEEVLHIRMTLVNEQDLDAAKSRYSHLTGMHIYSLSPSPLKDGGLICAPTDFVREVDGRNGAELAATVGKIVGPDSKIRPMEPIAKALHQAIAARAKGGPAAKVSLPKAETSKPAKLKEEPKESKVPEEPKEPLKVQRVGSKVLKVQEKPKVVKKASTKMEFFKPKASKVKEEEKETAAESEGSKAPTQFFTNSKLEVPKRGVKRKSPSTAVSDSENGGESLSNKPSKPPSDIKPSVRVAKGVVLSEDEDDNDGGETVVVTRASRRKSKIAAIVNSEAEKELHAMMDVDDNEVIRISRKSPVPRRENEEATETEAEPQVADNEDVEMDDTPVVTRAKPKRRTKKVVPLGQNGLKKRRVIKSRSLLDDKGYMVTEDYSSYESVDQADGEDVKPPTKAKASKGKAKQSEEKLEIEKQQKRTEAQTETEEDAPPPPPPKLKPLAKSGSSKQPTKNLKASKSISKNSQKFMSNFFGPAKK